MRRYIDGPEGQLHVRHKQPPVQTENPPLYCIHQSPSSSVAMAAVVSDMGADRACAAGDTPGFGESDPRETPPEIEDYAASHGAVIDGLGWSGPIDVFGFFTGSKIAVALALARPHQVRRLILFGAPLYTDDELAQERSTYKPDVYDWEGGHLSKWWAHLKAGARQPYPLALFARHFAEIQRGGPQSWWGHRAAFNVNLREWLPKVTQPTLVLCSADPQGEKSSATVNYLQKGKRVDIPYMGQGLLDLHTAEVCTHLRTFLDT
jgi:pimeloyl-ACP methyl ester carboxylesterase